MHGLFKQQRVPRIQHVTRSCRGDSPMSCVTESTAQDPQKPSPAKSQYSHEQFNAIDQHLRGNQLVTFQRLPMGPLSHSRMFECR